LRLFGFRVRDRQRDRETDLKRIQRLSAGFADLMNDIEAESAGLLARRQRAADDAAFSLEALENDGKGGMSSRVNELTVMMTRYSGRIAFLQSQMAFINDLRRHVESFAKVNGIGEPDADLRSWRVLA
jgi:hypothetical protein